MTEEQKINEKIEKLKKVERTDDNHSEYAKAQFELGETYHLQLNNYKQATDYYLNVLREDDHFLYLTAQYYLGSMYHSGLNQHEQAKEYYSNISKEDNTVYYAGAQCCLGIIFFQQKDYKSASDFFKNVCFDYAYAYYKSQLYLALINNNDNNYNDIEDILNNLDKIDECVLQIKEQLLVKLDSENDFERKFAHYTKPEVLFRFLKEKSKIRLSLVDLMNDPTENKVLRKWLNINPNQDSNRIKSFVSSFSFNHNSLNQFRLYGLEDNVHGSGISIAFNKDFFSKEPKDAINYEKITNKQNNKIIEEALEESKNSENSNESIFPLPLYRCVYFDPESNYIKIAKRNKQSFYREYREEGVDTIENKWKSYIEYIKEDEIVEVIRENLKEIRKKKEESITQIKESGKDYLLTVFEELINLAIMPISCLIKHSAFEDEDECRIMYTTHISDELIRGPDNYQAINTTLYLDYSEVGNFINKVYLGPKCKSSHQQWIEHEITKLNDKIKVQNSTLPLQ